MKSITESPLVRFSLLGIYSQNGDAIIRKLKILTAKKPRIFSLVHVDLPLHEAWLQGRVSLSGPEHGNPPNEGGGFVQVRLRSCCPTPQVTLHGPQFPKLLHPSFAKIKHSQLFYEKSFLPSIDKEY